MTTENMASYKPCQMIQMEKGSIKRASGAPRGRTTGKSISATVRVPVGHK